MNAQQKQKNEIRPPKNQIHRYIRDAKGNRRGIVVAVKDNGVVKIGYALCHTKKERFNVERGTSIALTRAISGFPKELPKAERTQQILSNALEDMRAGAQRYFKNTPIT